MWQEKYRNRLPKIWQKQKVWSDSIPPKLDHEKRNWTMRRVYDLRNSTFSQ